MSIGEVEEFFEQGFELGERELAGRGGERSLQHPPRNLETHGCNTNPVSPTTSIMKKATGNSMA